MPEKEWHCHNYESLNLDREAETWRMESSGMLRRVALVRTDVSDEHRNVRQLFVTASVVPSSPILVTLMIRNVGSYKSHTV
jgi:hypothetical protein